MGSFET